MALTFGNALTLIIALVNLLSGSLVFIKGKKAFLNISFAIFSFLTAIWIFSNFVFTIRPSLWIMQSQYAFGIIVMPAALIWLYSLIDRKIGTVKLAAIIIIGLTMFSLTFVNGLVIQGVEIASDGSYLLNVGAFFDYYSILVLSFYAFLLYKIISGLKRFSGAKKIQLRYILVGSLVFGGVSMIANFILPFFDIIPVAPYDAQSSLFFVILSTYAITKHHLFNIKIIATELLVGLVSLILLVELLLSKTLSVTLLKSGILIAFVYLGISLIRSSLEEIKKREKLEKMAEKLKLANVELRRLDQAKTEFLSIASHQLRTPLTAIRGYLSMIGEGDYGSIPEKAKETIKKTYQATTRLVGLTNSLLNVTRIETGKISFAPSLVSFPDLVSSVIQELKPDAEQKNLFLEYKKTKKKIPKVKIDQEKIRQVILNVLDNAIKYTTKGGITITLKVIETEQKLQLKIKDTGEGISASEMDKLFRSFSRGAAGSHLYSAGAGLGLYVARRFVDIHPGGTIWAESPGRGKGSTFYLELPIEETKGKHNF